MTVQELIDELMKVEDKSKQVYFAELEEKDDFPINVEAIEVEKYVKIDIYEN